MKLHCKRGNAGKTDGWRNKRRFERARVPRGGRKLVVGDENSRPLVGGRAGRSRVKLLGIGAAQSGARIGGGAFEIQECNWTATATVVRW